MRNRSMVLVVVIIGLASTVLFWGILRQQPIVIPDESKDKLGSGMIEVLSTTPTDIVIDSIVSCSVSNYLERAQEVVGNFTVLHNWNFFKGSTLGCIHGR